MNPPDSSTASFFDDDDLRDKEFIFTRPMLYHFKDLYTSPVITSPLNCHSSSTCMLKQGTFGLHHHTLVSYGTDDQKLPHLVLSVAYARVEFLSATDMNMNCGFRLTKNGEYFDFYSPNQQTIENWFHALKRICVLTSFHDDYKAVKTLGKGGFARVYMVECKKDKGSTYAAKAFNKNEILLSSKEKAKPAILNEIDMMRTLDHENIVKLYEVHETENSVYLVMELIKGKTLYDVLKKSTLKKTIANTEVRDMLQSMLEALSYISSFGIMHRDLKPSNILREKGGRIKIADFGLATYVKTKKYIFRKCGTPGYMAPEVFKYSEKDPLTHYNEACDMFSIGCVFFYMIFRYSFFDSYVSHEVSYQNKNYSMEFESIQMLKKEINNPSTKHNKDALNLLLRLLEVDPSKRITADEALEHPYFYVPHRKSQNTGSDFSNQTLKSIPIDVTFPSKTKAQTVNSLNETSDPGSYIALCANRFTDRDSVYLDVTKANSQVKSNESLEAINSIIVNPNTPSLNTLGLSAFAKPSPLQKNFNRRNSRGLTQMGSPYLKAAIRNNIQRQKGETEPDLEEVVKKNKKMEKYAYVRQNQNVKDDDWAISKHMDIVNMETFDLEDDLSEVQPETQDSDPFRYFSKAKRPSVNNLALKRNLGSFQY